MIYEFARTLVTESLCWLGEGRHDAALAACERALELAAPRNYRLIHADALNLRARAHRALGNDSEALRCGDRAAEWRRRLTRTPAE